MAGHKKREHGHFPLPKDFGRAAQPENSGGGQPACAEGREWLVLCRLFAGPEQCNSEYSGMSFLCLCNFGQMTPGRPTA